MRLQVRVRVENAGRVELDDAEAESLVRTKTFHIGMITMCVPASVWLAHATGTFGACALAALPLWLGGLAEAIVPGATVAETCKRIGQTLAACAFGGFVGVLCVSAGMGN